MLVKRARSRRLPNGDLSPNPEDQRLMARAPVERRERRPVSLRGYAALDDGRTGEILVVDLSYEGCGIEIPMELVAGQSIKLSVLRREAIEAQVRWYSRGKAGLIFRAEASPTKQHRSRKSKRVGLVAEVTMRRVGKSKYRVRVFDASPEGCKLECVERPRVGEHLFVKFGGLEALYAEVCWVEGFCTGVLFETAVHPAVFDLLVARLTGANSVQ